MFEEICVQEAFGVCIWATNNGPLIPLPNLIWAIIIIVGITYFLYKKSKNK